MGEFIYIYYIYRGMVLCVYCRCFWQSICGLCGPFTPITFLQVVFMVHVNLINYKVNYILWDITIL